MTTTDFLSGCKAISIDYLRSVDRNQPLQFLLLYRLYAKATSADTSCSLKKFTRM